MSKHSYGWKPRAVADPRDYKFQAPPPDRLVVPAVMSMLSGCPPVYDQLQEGSCTANAGSAAIGFQRNKQKLPYLTPSRNFLYYNTRALEGTTSSDAGASLADTMKAASAQGVCSEFRWPYTEADLTVKPSAADYTMALPNKVTSYLSVAQTQADMTSCLAMNYPFVFGISVYASFESDAADANGIIPMPNVSTEQLLGGHALLAIGFNLSGKTVTETIAGKKWNFPTDTVMFRNSWNASWGAGGYGFIPFEYLESTTLGSDLWSVRSVV